ncbi:protein PF14_0175-like isoform X2 [Pogonomyrmex barbatus]|uniref:Protein PF14_0175-like isoform X2 n=1 Tax=Pogonomyrmex barbatus TaxID=144034 RepID=A0A6I9WFP5_9HYME|nr:protein PF14_0175-like isoform X2 [Pogonomyrmex barbatus]
MQSVFISQVCAHHNKLCRHRDTRKKMNNTETDSSSMKSLETVLVKDANIIRMKTTANQAALHNAQSIRNLPNILRNSNIRTSRNHKSLTKTDTFFVSSAEDVNSSLELNTTLSSIDLDTEANCNTTASPKPHHQRKQVHNPLDVQYDTLDCNNNKNINMPQKINTSRVSNCKKNTSMKRLKYSNKQKKRLHNKKSKKATTRKSGSRKQMSRKRTNFNTLTAIPDVNMKNVIVQNTNNFFNNNIHTQPTFGPNIININVNNDIINSIATNSVNSSDISYCNTEAYGVEEKYGANPVVSFISTDFNTSQNKIIQRDITSCEFPTMENSSQGELIDRYIGCNFLYESKVLYSCTCANCMSHDKDLIFHEDPISTSTSSSDDMETDLTCDLYTNIYDFYVDNDFNLFGDNLVIDKNLFREEFREEKNIKKNVCTINNSTKDELVESIANMSSTEPSKSYNLQSCHIDRIQDMYIKSHSTELTHSTGTARMENIRDFNEMNISNYPNLDKLSMKENKITSEKEAPIQTAILTDVPSVFNSKYQMQENKKDLCVIQCYQCGKLFNKRQLWKHFTYCDFYKENFTCHICSKTYRHKSSLAQHLRITHNVLYNSHGKSYTCTKCSKSYVRYRAFQRHVLFHDN